MVFTTKDILSFYRETEPSIPSSTVNWRVYSLVNLGVLLRIGKGKFKLGQGSLYIPELDNRIIKISKTVKEKFPFIQYCIWGSSSIIEFGHQMLTIGGLIGDEMDGRKVLACNFEGMNFIRRNVNDDTFHIRVPKITKKERLYLDHKMPLKEGWSPKEFEISEDDLNAYNAIYRYYPSFAELLI